MLSVPINPVSEGMSRACFLSLCFCSVLMRVQLRKPFCSKGQMGESGSATHAHKEQSSSLNVVLRLELGLLATVLPMKLQNKVT